MKCSKKDFEAYERVSRILVRLPLVLLIFMAILSLIKNYWINLLNSAIFFFALTAMLINFMCPGILVILGKPWLAQAWLRGINSSSIPSISWNDLPVGKKSKVYFFSIVNLAFAMLGILIFILILVRRPD